MIEYCDSYEVKIQRKLNNIHEIVINDIGIIIAFGNPPSKIGHPKLHSVIFMKERWTQTEAYDWWRDHQIYFVKESRLGKKVPVVDFWVKVFGYYVLACVRESQKEAVKKQICECKIIKE